jgi:hypothetical protein
MGCSVCEPDLETKGSSQILRSTSAPREFPQAVRREINSGTDDVIFLEKKSVETDEGFAVKTSLERQLPK